MAVKLSALRAGRPLPPRKIPGTQFCYRLSRPQGHSAAGRMKPIEKSNNLIGNRNRDLPACSVVPQPTTLPRAPLQNRLIYYWGGGSWVLSFRIIMPYSPFRVNWRFGGTSCRHLHDWSVSSKHNSYCEVSDSRCHDCNKKKIPGMWGRVVR
jgi:hypothetical protein